jgi:threonyl-tRNA synthetase
MPEEINVEIKRHSLAHIMASAIKELYPKAQLAIGPAIDNGFYYDVDFYDVKITEADLKNIEKKMAFKIKQNLKFERTESEINEALKAAKAAGEVIKQS